MAEVEIVETTMNGRQRVVGLRDGKVVFEKIQQEGQKLGFLLNFYYDGKLVMGILRDSRGRSTITTHPNSTIEVTVSLDEHQSPTLIYITNEAGEVIDGAKLKNGVLTPIDLDASAKR